MSKNSYQAQKEELFIQLEEKFFRKIEDESHKLAEKLMEKNGSTIRGSAKTDYCANPVDGWFNRIPRYCIEDSGFDF